MSGKYTKQGVFPLILDGSASTVASDTWGEDIPKVGLVKITGQHIVTFDSTNYPADNSGDTVVVYNTGTSSSSVGVVITPDPFTDDSADTITVGPGDSCTVMYHHDHGWIALGFVAAA
jgi:hypothetical protein